MNTNAIIKAVSNTDDVEIIWRYPKFIKDCWGFALLRQKKGESPTVSDWVKSSVGFDGDPHKDFEFHDTSMWPIQKFMWTDFFVKNGDTVRYKVIPMVHDGTGLQKNEDESTDWSNWVTLKSNATDAFFNRGIVSSQFVSRRLAGLPAKDRKKSLDEHLEDPKSPLREFMGAELLQAVYRILDEPTLQGNSNVHLFAALYELNDGVLISKLNKLGKRANVILANGAFNKKDSDPQKKNAAFLTKVKLTRRIVSSPHFAHNKFVVLARKVEDGFVPYKVLTGSTNWTHNGLFTQVNNAVIIDDAKVAEYYFDEWGKIFEDCSDDGKGLYSKPYKDFNALEKMGGNISTWFTPTKNQADMNEAINLINGAKQGILFLMFKPGDERSSVLYNAIRDRAKEKNPPFVHGVINGDPGGKKNPTIEFMNKGKVQKGNMNIVTPANIKAQFGFWNNELPKPSVTIHSKIIVIDPFGKNPILITGSHNMGSKASRSNDDNLNIIRGNAQLCQGYAVHMLSVYHHFRWRFYRSTVTDKKGKETEGTPKWSGLVKSDQWQKWSTTGENKAEIDFWLGGSK